MAIPIYPTAEQLRNASKDANTLDKFGNDPAGVPNINRVGNDVENMMTLRQRMLDAAADVANRKVYLTEAEMLADTSQPVKTPARVETGEGAGDYVMTASGWVLSDIQVANSRDVAEAQTTANTAIGAVGLARSTPWRCFYQYRGDKGGTDVVDSRGVVIGGTKANEGVWLQSIFGPSRRCFYQYRGDRGGDDVVDKFGTIFEGGNVIKQISIGGAVTSGLYVRKSNSTQLSLFFKGNPGANWIELILERVTVPFNGSTARTNADLWRLINGYETDGNFTRLYSGNVIVNSGEWECAIGVPGAADHVGGYHGFERQSMYYVLIDGLSDDIDGWTGAQRVRSIDFVQVSDIYRHGTESEVLAKHYKHYEFGSTGFVLDQRLEWTQTIQLSTAYLGMLPIVRRAIDNTTGPLITEYARRSPVLSDLDPNSPIAPFTVEDIRELGAPQFETKDTQAITIWGEASGISVTMEIIDMTRLDSAQLHIQTDRPQYNKIYNAPGTNALVNAGDVWHARIRYTFNTTN